MNHILFSICELAGVARVKFTRKKTAPANIFTAHADFELFFNDHASLISFGQELDRQFELFQEEMETAMTDLREELYQNLPRYRRKVKDRLLALFPKQNKEQILLERISFEKTILITEKPDKRITDRILLFMYAQENLLQRLDTFLENCHNQLLGHPGGQRLPGPVQFVPVNQPADTNKLPKLKWADTKSSLVELIYALHRSGSITDENDQKVTFDLLARFFSTQLNMHLSQPQGLMAAIRRRKKDETSFIYQMYLKTK